MYAIAHGETNLVEVAAGIFNIVVVSSIPFTSRATIKSPSIPPLLVTFTDISTAFGRRRIDINLSYLEYRWRFWLRRQGIIFQFTLDNIETEMAYIEES
jgi:hypothetical protein